MIANPFQMVAARMQAVAKPSKATERDDTAPKDRNGDDNNGPSRGSQSAPAAGGATPGTNAASGSAQGNRGGAAGPSSMASIGERRQSTTDRRRTAGKPNIWLSAWPVKVVSCYGYPTMPGRPSISDKDIESSSLSLLWITVCMWA